ncbi:MAG TPA: sugar ABC transporter permease [Caldilineaceae bacterium]|nr:sugar ABC transporter permease [Caldilineaceae bacterium]
MSTTTSVKGPWAGEQTAPLSWWSRLANNEHVVGYLFVAPLILGLLVFTYGPVLAAFGLSFTKGDYISTPRWIGLGNYQALLNDDLFWRSLRNTVYYVVGVVPAGLVLSLLLALAMNQKLRGIVFFRTIYFLPTITSSVAISLMWLWIYNPEFGVLNFLLRQIGIKGPAWLSTPEWAMPAVIIMAIWRGLGYNMLIFLAGLQGIPEVYYEAAEIDGAGPFAKFWYITVPLLSPTTFMLLILGLIGAFQVFEYTYVMTGGGPVYATLTIVLHIYNNAFRNFQMGYASALAYVLFFILLALTVIQFRLQHRWVHYE